MCEEALARQLRWSVRAEVGIAVTVLSLTTVLVATPPGSRPAPGGTGVRTVEVALPGGGRAEVTLNPALVGATSLAVSVLDAKGGVWDVPEVRATLDLPAQHISALKVALTRTGPGEYGSQGLIIPAKGGWQLVLTVRTTDIDESTEQAVVEVD
jgi:copper transport protein